MCGKATASLLIAVLVSVFVVAHATYSKHCYEYHVDASFCTERDSYFASQTSIGSTSECAKIARENASVTFFIYNGFAHECELFDMPLDDFYAACDWVDGPEFPIRSDCLASNSPCAGFRHVDNCMHKSSTTLDYVHHLPSEEMCQIVCQDYDKCDSYLFEKSVGTCVLYANVDAPCTSIIGEDLSEDYTSPYCTPPPR